MFLNYLDVWTLALSLSGEGPDPGVSGLGRPDWPQRGQGRPGQVLQTGHHEHRHPVPCIRLQE